MLFLLFSVTVGISQAASIGEVKWWEPEPYKCDGKVYYNSPMVYYYATGVDLCVARRKGCVPSGKQDVYSTMEECHKAKFPRGRKKTVSFMCEDRLWNKQPYVEKQGSEKVVIFSDAKCGIREKFCPEGYVCQMAPGGKDYSACCSLTQNTLSGSVTKSVYAWNMFDKK